MAISRLCSIPDCGKQSLKRGWCTAHYKRWQRHGDPLAGRTRNGSPEEWIEQHLQYKGADCLIWPFARVENGYGRIRHDGRSYVASRYMCERAHGPAPSQEHESAHSCGNGHEGCINPNHLSWKTPSENNADKLAHGTHNRGEQHPMSKLTEPEVRSIFYDRRVYQDIAYDYGISIITVCDIKRRRSWPWLDMDAA